VHRLRHQLLPGWKRACLRDRIMQRMLPAKPTVVGTKGLKPEVVMMKPAQDRV